MTKEERIKNNLNEMLTSLFSLITETQNRVVINSGLKDVTENDMKIIEAVGVKEPRRMTDIAKALDVTVGTLTTNMNSLEKKGYILRQKGETDKRVVLVTLTEEGRKVFFTHRDFHKKMIKAVIKEFTPEEQEILLRGVKRLNEFFVSYEG